MKDCHLHITFSLSNNSYVEISSVALTETPEYFEVWGCRFFSKYITKLSLYYKKLLRDLLAIILPWACKSTLKMVS